MASPATDDAFPIVDASEKEVKQITYAELSAAIGSTVDIAAMIHAATSKTTPIDADELGIWDSVSAALRKLTWANIKSTLKTYFDGIYSALGHTHAHNDTTSKQAALIAPIADGSGSGELDYGDMTDAGRLSEPTVSGSDNIMRLERDFANNSGGSITIKEVGLSAKGLDALGLLLMRGKVDKAVADGASVRVAIELETSV